MRDPGTVHDFHVPMGPIGYGCWRFTHPSDDPPRARIEAALEAGMTLVDTADVYGYPEPGFGAAEEELGRVLAEAPQLRDRIILATKGGIRPPVPYDSSPDGLRRACEDSLRRLGVDTIDLYQIHRPDLLAHPEDVAATLRSLHDEGKIRAIGTSNHTASQTAALARVLGLPVVADQTEFHPLRPEPLEDGTIDAAMVAHRWFLAWSPLGGGRLAGDVAHDPGAAAVAALCDDIADEQGVTRTAVLLAWLLRHPAAVVPIVGTQRVDRIRDAARATEVTMDATTWYAILAAGRGEPLP